MYLCAGVKDTGKTRGRCVERRRDLEFFSVILVKKSLAEMCKRRMKWQELLGV